MNKREVNGMNESASIVAWRKSTYSGSSDNCVEIAAISRTIVIRDSKDPDGPRIHLGQSAWTELVRGVQHNV